MITDNLEVAIRRTYVSLAFWDLIDSAGIGGPFNGACLVCAEALRLAIGEGDIVRIEEPSTGVTHHYGLRTGGTIYDFDGACDSFSWIQRFARNENLEDRELKVVTGICDSSSITEDECLSKRLSILLIKQMPESEMRLAS